MGVNISAQEIITALVLFAVFSLPGWAFLAVTGLWKAWDGLQRWCAAVGISIVFYPILFYWLRAVLPGFHLGERKLIVLLLLFLLVVAWSVWKNRRSLFIPRESDWAVIGVAAAVIFTRLWMAHLHPYPAWADSLHHTLLTQLTAQNGQIPYTMDPFEPVSLNMYHLGLYAISAVVQLVARIPAYMALLWTSQALNAFCVLGVFFVLDRKVSRQAALVGAVVVGLLSIQPAWYVNWGRFTQAASQAVLPIAWLVNWEAIAAWAQPGKPRWGNLLGLAAAGAALSAGMFMLHFRVAGFYLPLLAISVFVELVRAYRCKTFRRAMLGITSIGAVSILFTAPVLFQAFAAYVDNRLAASAAGAELSSAGYYQFPFSAHFPNAFQPWLFVVGVLALLLGLARKNRLSWIMLAWVALLWLEGNAYRLNIPLISFTNYSAIVILYYLPLALVIGAGLHEALILLPQSVARHAASAGLAFLLLAGFAGSHARVAGVEPFRYFMTSADEAAMRWINQSTPPDAVFAINTYAWNSYYHGMDGGYWIPYFTNRKTTIGTMMYSHSSPEHTEKINQQSVLVKQMEEDSSAAADLCAMGVRYVYLGANRQLPTSRLTQQSVEAIPGAERVYNQQGVMIYQICPP